MLTQKRVFDEGAVAPFTTTWSGNTCTITHHSTQQGDAGRINRPGYRLDQALNQHELSVKNIGADTWTVSYIGQDGVTRVYNDNSGSGFVEGDTVIVRNVRPLGIIVEVSGATNAGSRVVTMVSSVRRLEE